ncbi:Bro-N domain-containing protein [Commensalibacter sp. A3DC]|uniref:BRO-N domain-containing protein n=1 Tax=Commensalibacter sp. A3DC TaxID=3093920 RepID=UPI0039B5C422
MTNHNITTFDEKSNPITLFNFNSIDVRVFTKDNKAWFVLNDVCKILELENSRNVTARLDNDEKDYVHIMDAIGRERETTIINESGLYSLILRSRKSEAKRFKKWVTSEVLPSIRKTGGYLLSPGQYGGITKSVVNKAVAILRKDFEKVYRDVEFLKTGFDPSAAFVTYYKPIIAVLKEKNVPQKGRRTLSCRCSGRIHRYLIRTDKASMIQISRETGRYIYHIDGISEWLGYEGENIIRNHIDKVMGQGRLHLVPTTNNSIKH